MLISKNKALIILSFIPSSFVISQETCNVLTGDRSTFISTVSDDFSDFVVDEEIKLTRFASIEETDIEIVNEDVDGVTSQVWFLEQERVVDGFLAEVSFEYNAGESDGFAFVVQNDKTTNVFAGGAELLGFQDGLDNYLAVSLDTCANRVEDSNCGEYTVRILSKLPGEDEVVLASDTFDRNVLDMTNGVIAGLQVAFLQDIGDFGQVSVVLSNNGDADRTLVGNLTSSLEEILGSKFGTLGFTASNSANNPATILIRQLVFSQMNSGTRLITPAQSAQPVTAGRQVTFTLVFSDSCNNQLSAEDAELLQVNVTSDVVATLTEQVDENPEILTTVPVKQDDGTIALTFVTPQGIFALWDLNIEVQGVLAQEMPFAGAVDTQEVNEGGLSQQGIILLVCLIAVLIVVTVYMVRRLDYFRKKLKEHEEDIDYGRVKEEVDEIEKTISYQTNPMIAPLDEMKDKLARNMRILEDLRSGQDNAMDSNYTVDQLVAENEKLRAEMNRLKKEEQLREAANRSATQGRKKFNAGGGNVKRDFDQERA
eukprot:augustus_masked-scaffold_5-processed-gene-3.35-mRNA-1 protein AED:1.00 eAED:1.00 QI:0/-1/0/0/-1/1/1/0/539